jgi:NADH-quinone oxidoreductase subunit N
MEMSSFYSEVTLALVAIALVLVDAIFWPRRSSRGNGYLALCGSLIALAFSLWEWEASAIGYSIGDAISQDAFSAFFDVLILSAEIGVLLLCLHEAQTRVRDEFYILLSLSALGMMLAVSAVDLLVAFLAMELAGLPLYVLAAREGRSRIQGEAAAKFLHWGLLSSAFFVFSAGLLYMTTGATALVDVAAYWADEDANGIARIGAALLVASLLFKAGMVPFHYWLVDVREGATTSLAAFIASAGAASALAILVRVLTTSLGPLRPIWTPSIAAFAALAIVAAALMALNQRSLKRLLAYLVVVQGGCFLAAFSSGRAEGLAAALFWIVVAALGIVALFAVVLLGSSPRRTNPSLSAYGGLGRERPWLGLLISVSLLSVAGLPPTAGFHARLYVVYALVDAQLSWLAILFVASFPLIFYACAKLWVHMYFRPVPTALRAEPSAELLAVLLLAATAALGFGLAPEVLMETARSAAASLL